MAVANQTPEEQRSWKYTYACLCLIVCLNVGILIVCRLLLDALNEFDEPIIDGDTPCQFAFVVVVAVVALVIVAYGLVTAAVRATIIATMRLSNQLDDLQLKHFANNKKQSIMQIFVDLRAFGIISRFNKRSLNDQRRWCHLFR
uniref:Uncharacterized protein n=1 Tax=Panagrolaimus sp. JU765 TaxID=591449 RepID=A0AC34R0L4_9BILA